MRRLLLSCLLLSPCLQLPHLLYGQEGRAPLQPGDRIRVYAPSEYQDRVVGSIWSMERDAILVKNETNITWCIAYPTITRLEVSRGRRSGASGALRGLLIGGGAGTLVGLVAVLSTCNKDDADPLECGYAWDGFAIVASIGALLGTTLGALSPGERWEGVPLERLRLQPLATPDGRFGLAASVRF